MERGQQFVYSTVHGNYFFSYATGAPGVNTPFGIYLTINGATVGVTFVNDDVHNNNIMMRSATMLQLSANAVVTYQSFNGGNYGSTDGLINAQGFLYSPLDGAAAAVAWSVKGPAATEGPVTVVLFATINVNLQGV
jgi:hypothetical protein